MARMSSGFFWNIALTTEFKAMEMFPGSPKFVGLEGRSYDVHSGGPLAWTPATVIVFDKDGKKRISRHRVGILLKLRRSAGA